LFDARRRAEEPVELAAQPESRLRSPFGAHR
jgi:hypothetical protein